ncbi:MAG: thioredoxin family protein [Acidimicrobiia bacterium]|nr:thioredoxin family protein [Acidimicrobiia bacterium]
MSITEHAVVSPEEWKAARLAFLEREKAFTRERDELSAARRELPWTEITTDYRFDTPHGEVSLTDLFGENTQLLLYHFMMGPDWTEGCPSCSFWADNYDGTIVHLAHRDTAFAAVSRTSVENIEAYRERMGWDFPWVSSLNSSFNFDLGVSFTPEQIASGEPLYNYGTQVFGGEEAPGLSTFIRDDDGRIFLTYQTFSRGLDMLNGTYHHLDLMPKGRDEDDLEWSMQWLHRHDAYPQ